MRPVHLLITAVPAIIGQAQIPVKTTVNFTKMRSDLEFAGRIFEELKNAHIASGKTEVSFLMDVPMFLKAFEKDLKGRSDEREARLLLELWLSVGNLGNPSQMPVVKKLAENVIKEIPASYEGWTLEPEWCPKILTILLGKSSEPYMREMKEKGHPEVRMYLRLSEVETLINQGKGEEAKVMAAQFRKEFATVTSFATAKARVDAAIKKVELRTTALAPGQPAPDFTVASLDDPKVTFTKGSFQGKYLLLDFWGTWCTWCVKELPTTHKLYEIYKGKGLEILSLAVNDPSPETVQKFRQKPSYPMPWKHAFLAGSRDPNMLAQPMMVAYAVETFPTLFLIGPDGKILATTDELRGEKLGETLAKHMGVSENPTPAAASPDAGQGGATDPDMAKLPAKMREGAEKMVAEIEKETDVAKLKTDLAQMEGLVGQMPEEAKPIFEFGCKKMRARIKKLEGK